MDCKIGRLGKATIYLLVLIGGATGVRNLEMIVPAMLKSGDTARLSCRYVLEGAPLYTVQWYLGEQEFYRYVPKKSPPQLVHAVEGIDVDPLHSNMNDVTLRNVSRETAGTFKCEVSEDQPTYHTVTKKREMQVVELPETDPVIEIERMRLPIGETLRANCTTGNSYPTPNVTWSVNGEILNDSSMQYRTWTRKINQGRSDSTISGLELKIFGRMFRHGQIRIRCSTNILPLYSASTEIEINEDRPLIASITGDASPHSDRSGSSGNFKLNSIFNLQELNRAILMSSSLVISMLNLR